MRRLRWPALAVLLLGAAASLTLLCGRAPRPPRAAVAAEFPRWREQETARLRRRATLVLPPAPGAAPAPKPPPAGAPRRDPFLVALPVKPDSPVVVFEANALRHSRLGELLLACISAREPTRLADVARDTGIDPLKDIDRIAFLGDALVVSGFFQRLRWGELAGPAEPYGRDGRLFQVRGKAVGAWGDGIVLVADRPEQVRQAIDQLEGRSPVPPTGVPEELSYGDIYGALPAAALRGLLGGGELSDRLAAVASRIEVNVSAMQDVAATVRIRGGDAAALAELSRSLAGALASARAQAHQAGDDRLAALLDGAALRPAGTELAIQLAVPADRLPEWFAGCERWGPPP
jgi:hypothetical protein